MKTKNLLVLAIIVISISGETFAQERMFGNGRFLRRLTGRSQPTQAKNKKQPSKTKAKSSTKSKTPTKAPTPATPQQPTQPKKPSTYARPTPAAGNQSSMGKQSAIGSGVSRTNQVYQQRPKAYPGSQRQPQLANQLQRQLPNQSQNRYPIRSSSAYPANANQRTPTQPTSQSYLSRTNSYSQNSRPTPKTNPSYQLRSAQPTSASTRKPLVSITNQPVATRKATQPTVAKSPKTEPVNSFAKRVETGRQDSGRTTPEISKGFGMVVEQKGKNLVVAQVARKGNAAKAGVRKGDYIVNIGGINIDAIRDFNEIAGVLGQGDQIEITTYRGQDKEAKLTIQMGTNEDVEAYQAAQAKQQKETEAQPTIQSKLKFQPPKVVSDVGVESLKGSNDFQPQSSNGLQSVLSRGVNKQQPAVQRVEKYQEKIRRLERELNQLRQTQQPGIPVLKSSLNGPR